MALNYCFLSFFAVDSQTCCWEKHANLISAAVQVINTRSFAFISQAQSFLTSCAYFINVGWTGFILTSLQSRYNYYFYFTDESSFILLLFLMKSQVCGESLGVSPEVICHHRTRLCQPEVRHVERTLFSPCHISPQLVLGQFCSSLPISPISARDT